MHKSVFFTAFFPTKTIFRGAFWNTCLVTRALLPPIVTPARVRNGGSSFATVPHFPRGHHPAGSEGARASAAGPHPQLPSQRDLEPQPARAGTRRALGQRQLPR